MVLVIGSTNLDQVGTVTRLPQPGETVAGGSFSTSPGGKGANQALAARRAGADVRFFSAVGNDVFAGQALAHLRADGVDLSGVTEAATHTGIAMILLDAAGENAIAVLPGANATVGETHVRQAFAAVAPGTHLLLQQEVPAAVNHLALDLARAAGVVSILNTAPYLPETPDLAAKADIVIANETEFALLTGAAPSDAAIAAHAAAGGQVVIVTLGGKGAVVADSGGLTHVAAPRVTVVDTVGAGDTFCGYLGAGLEAGLPMSAAMARAVRAASIAVTRHGAQAGIPWAAEISSGT